MAAKPIIIPILPREGTRASATVVDGRQVAPAQRQDIIVTRSRSLAVDEERLSRPLPNYQEPDANENNPTETESEDWADNASDHEYIMRDDTDDRDHRQGRRRSGSRRRFSAAFLVARMDMIAPENTPVPRREKTFRELMEDHENNPNISLAREISGEDLEAKSEAAETKVAV